jgi:hypothetical protein
MIAAPCLRWKSWRNLSRSSRDSKAGEGGGEAISSWPRDSGPGCCTDSGGGDSGKGEIGSLKSSIAAVLMTKSSITIMTIAVAMERKKVMVSWKMCVLEACCHTAWAQGCVRRLGAKANQIKEKNGSAQMLSE